MSVFVVHTTIFDSCRRIFKYNMIYSVQYMRAIASFMVVLSQSAFKGEQYSSDPLSWFNIGGAGVDLFL